MLLRLIFLIQLLARASIVNSGGDMDERINPWTTLSRSIVYENDWIRVDHHEVLNPTGGPGVYGTVHFKNHAVGIVPIDANGNVVLVGQYRFPVGAYS
jgi:ADP-ribose pyrophosphatase